MIEIKYDDRELRQAITQLEKLGGDLQPAIKDMGEYLVTATKRRFADKTAPDGSAWSPNKPVTQARKGRDDPLIGETHRLSDEISYEVLRDGLAVGSSLEYAAVQQFGADKGAFGRTKKNRPIPWGDIPARPFLGLSAADKRELLDIVNEHIEQTLR